MSFDLKADDTQFSTAANVDDHMVDDDDIVGDDDAGDRVVLDTSPLKKLKRRKPKQLVHFEPIISDDDNGNGGQSPMDIDDDDDNINLDSSASSFPISTIGRRKRRQPNSPPVASAAVTLAASLAPAGPLPNADPSETGELDRRPWQMTTDDFNRCQFDYRLWYSRYKIFSAHAPIKTLEETKPIPLAPELKAERQKELAYIVDDLYSIWTSGCSLNSSDRQSSSSIQVDVLGIAYAMFFNTHTTLVHLRIEVIDDKMRLLEEPVMNLFSLHKLYDYADSDNEEHSRSLSKLNSVFMAMRNAYRMFLHICAAELALNPASAGIVPSKKVLFFVESYTLAPSRLEDAKPFTRFILYLIRVASQAGLRRYRGGVYSEEVTPEGFRTYHWKRRMDIEQFVYKQIARENGFETFDMGVGGGKIKDAVSFLTDFHDAEFPFVHVDRHVFSFRNGVYFAAQRVFRRYVDGAINWGIDSKVTDKRRRMGKIGGQYGELAGKSFTNASANYFDIEFVEYTRWENIPTPTVDKLLNDQDIPQDAQRIVWGMLGRVLYNVGELDDWQIILYLLGRANSGKSTLCKIIPIFYRKEDVAVISNNIEEQFGLQAVYSKLAFIAPEIKKDFRLPQAHFQSMVSGEGMSVAVKFKEAVSVEWQVPGIIAGNDVPSWVDNSNSVVRRVAMVHFQKPILKVDGEIANKLKEEVAAILLKANQAYHMMLEDYGTRGIWEMLPPYFNETQDRLKSKTHPLYNFLQFGDIEFVDRSLYISVEAFRNAFMNHCNKMNIPRPIWTEELYSVPLQDKKLEIERAASIEWPIGSGIKLANYPIIRGVILREHRYALSQQLPEAFSKGDGPSPIRDQDGGGASRTTTQPTLATLATIVPAEKRGLVTHKAIPSFGSLTGVK